MTHIQFHLADLETFDSPQPFDGIIVRFVLMYQADPAAALRRMLRLLRPEGVVAFLEMDITAAHSVPPVALVETALEWVRQTLRRAHIPLDLGPRVWRSFHAAGLRDSSLMVRWKAEPAPALAGTQHLADTVRSVLPMMERSGVVSASEVDIPTLATRLQEALVTEQATFFPPAVIGTWSRKPQ